MRADEKLTAFMELETAMRQNRIDTVRLGRGRTRAKSVRHPPQELHLTLFPQGDDQERPAKRPVGQ